MRVKIPRRAVPVETSVLAPNLRPGRTHWCWGAPLPATATTVVGVRWMDGGCDFHFIRLLQGFLFQTLGFVFCFCGPQPRDQTY